jgi:hypothetical protein
MNRRGFLRLVSPLPVALALATPLGATTGVRRRGASAADVNLLWGTLSFGLKGFIDEDIDHAAGRYNVRLTGEGDGIANEAQTAGRLLEGRWVPERSTSSFRVRGRESRLVLGYDWASRRVDYDFKGETFFLRRLRIVRDQVTVPPHVSVDDALSALLNYAEARWRPESDGVYRTHVVRRRRRHGEGPDDVDRDARAELVPLVLRPEREAATREPAVLFDMSRFSSWARPDEPAGVVFDLRRRPQLITSSLMLGTSINVTFEDA